MILRSLGSMVSCEDDNVPLGVRRSALGDRKFYAVCDQEMDNDSVLGKYTCEHFVSDKLVNLINSDLKMHANMSHFKYGAFAPRKTNWYPKNHGLGENKNCHNTQGFLKFQASCTCNQHFL